MPLASRALGGHLEGKHDILTSSWESHSHPRQTRGSITLVGDFEGQADPVDRREEVARSRENARRRTVSKF